ncbi:MAG: hypothetical protein BGN86_12225 [Caulobacterales bacterium 68-7]|nr:MAG: hypothetical protein BGN86_12225 [Caulobacterales bacterium 68-7]
MLIGRLFQRDQPFVPIESRLLAEGTITLGRDPSADWVLPDQAGLLSRIHCSLAYDGARLLLTDLSTNGVFLETGERAPKGEAIEIGWRSPLQLADLSLTVEMSEPEEVDLSATRLLPAVIISQGVGLSDATDAESATAKGGDGALLEAFCAGAGLEVSALSGEDPAELMRRLGRVYKQTVTGLAVLMTERAKAKRQSELDRTTIGAADNNPFKWSNPRQVAQDLLLSCEERGFLTDSAAVEASFKDVADHLAALSTAAGLAVDMTLEALSPESIEAEARTLGSLLRSKAAACWDLYGQRHLRETSESATRTRAGAALERAYAERASDGRL